MNPRQRTTITRVLPAALAAAVLPLVGCAAGDDRADLDAATPTLAEASGSEPPAGEDPSELDRATPSAQEAGGPTGAVRGTRAGSADADAEAGRSAGVLPTARELVAPEWCRDVAETSFRCVSADGPTMLAARDAAVARAHAEIAPDARIFRLAIAPFRAGPGETAYRAFVLVAEPG